jgi:two-component sensor histidine kinase
MPDAERSPESSELEQSLREALAQQEQATAQREALYRELIHRVKNHLQIMTSLLALEARDPSLSGKDLGDQMKGRLQTLAAIYRGMERAEAGARIEARTFVEEVCGSYASKAVSVNVAVEPPDLTLTSKQAAPVGLLMNEAVRHSSERLVRGPGGRVQVSLRRLQPGRLRLEIADDSVERGPAEPGRAPHGPDLMSMFAKQLQGELEPSDRAGGGAMVAAEFPEAA